MISKRRFARSFIVGTILALSILAAAAETPTMTAVMTSTVVQFLDAGTA